LRNCFRFGPESRQAGGSARGVEIGRHSVIRVSKTGGRDHALRTLGPTRGTQATAVSTQVKATVQSVDLTQSPPLLSIGGQTYTMNQLQQIVAPGY